MSASLSQSSLASGTLSKNPFTLTRWLLTKQQQHPEATGDFTIILNSIQLAIKIISSAASQAGLYHLYGVSQFQQNNPSGDTVKRLDVFANDCMINCLSFTGKVKYMVSEENTGVIIPNPPAVNGRYIVAFDPLDGSSNIDANVSVGTIFGIFRVPDDEDDIKITDPDGVSRLEKLVSKPGTELVCSGYSMYGDATVLVLTFGDADGVSMFTLEPQIGEFILTFNNVRVPSTGSYYSVNEGNYIKWDPNMQAYIDSCKRPLEHPDHQKQRNKPMKLRYVGSMVADIHRTLLYGGIFLYPGDDKTPRGKLRLMYEAAPMAFLMETAGGCAHTGKQAILEVVPTAGEIQTIATIQENNMADPHARVPVIMGSSFEVLRAVAMLNPEDESVVAAEEERLAQRNAAYQMQVNRRASESKAAAQRRLDSLVARRQSGAVLPS